MLDAEADGITELARAGAVAVPAVCACFAVGAYGCLALEWIDLAAGAPASAARLGEALASQHRVVQPLYGYRRDNWLGGSLQRNTPSASWSRFFADCRLQPQVERARARGLPAAQLHAAARIVAAVPALLGGHEPPASLLHGDLWGGNWGADRAGRPYVYDPAPYYGDRETDLALTRLFGGFGPEFYVAYEASWPLPPGSALRVELYNLYHLLNHYNLFGTSYSRPLAASLDTLLDRCARG